MSQSSIDDYDIAAAQLAHSDEVDFQATALEEDDLEVAERHQKDDEEDGEFRLSQQSSQDNSSDFCASQSSQTSHTTLDHSESGSDYSDDEDYLDGNCAPSSSQKEADDDPDDPTYYPPTHRKES